MNHEPDDRDAPRWLRLAATRGAEPAPDTLARVRARLAAREVAPGWLTWLSRPVAVAASATLLIASAWGGVALLGSAGEVAEPVSLTAALLGDDGALGFDPTSIEGEAGADSQSVAP